MTKQQILENKIRKIVKKKLAESGFERAENYKKIAEQIRRSLKVLADDYFRSIGDAKIIKEFSDHAAQDIMDLLNENELL